jgi:hypothetical protein
MYLAPRMYRFVKQRFLHGLNSDSR